MSRRKGVAVRRSAKEWQSIMRRFERSGQTSEQFCRSEALALSTFWLWRRKLGGLGSADEGSVRSAFVELAEEPPAPIWEAELDLGDGVVLRLRRALRC